MTLFAELNGTRVVTGAIVIMSLGIWYADVLLDKTAPITGPQSLSLGPLTMKCTAIGGGDFTGSTRVRVAGGAAGWRKTLKPKSYSHNVGVRKSTVISDAAREVGETVQIDKDGALGPAFVRQASIAARVLEQCGDPWFVRPDGVTQVGVRSNAVIPSQFEVMSVQLAIGQIIVATDNPQDWTPGRRFSTDTLSQKTLSTVIHSIEKGALRTEAWIL